MTLPALIAIGSIFLLAVLIAVLISEKSKYKKLQSALARNDKNQTFILDIHKELQAVSGYGKNLEAIVDVLMENLSKEYKFSTISSLFLKKNRFTYKTGVHETVSHAFIDHIKDTMHHAFKTDLNNQTAEKTESSIITDLETIDESITGVPLDDLGESVIKSTIDLKIAVGADTAAIINMSSTVENLYSETDQKTLSTISELVSSLLTRITTLIDIEKDKTLAMIDSFTEGIFMIDINHNLNSINKSASDILSVHREDPTINDLLSSLPNTYNFREKIDQAITQKKSIEETNVPIREKIFKIIITPVTEINSKESSLPADRQEIIGVSVILNDITSEKSLTQIKEDFTNIMVHELRSPLTAIMAASQFLLSQADLNTEEKGKLVHMISDSSRKMLDEIALILDSAKLDAGLFSVRKSPSDLRKLITDRIAVFTPLAAEKSIDLKVDIDPNLNIFSFDPIRIDEVINNLLSNSLKFTPSHGTISLSVHTMSDKVIVAISDSGEGIPKDKQDKLFSKFQQAPTDGQHQGTGLGLYVVKGVIEAHGGSVKLESEVGQGTTISFLLPLDLSYKPKSETSVSNQPEPNPNTQKLVN